MRTQINTMEIENAFKEVEIKSAVCIGLDYGFYVNVSRTYRDVTVRLTEVYTDGREWDIEEITIQFLNDCDVNDNIKNKIRVLRKSKDLKSESCDAIKVIEEIEVFDAWCDALPHIMNLVWSIENA